LQRLSIAQLRQRFAELFGEADGFAYAGRVYPSLSVVAKAITASHTNGFRFFRNCLNHHKQNA
jgi:hypothetical protein